MSLDWYQDIVDFHNEVMEDTFVTYPHLPTPRYSKLRFKLVKEEMEEVLEAIHMDDLVGIADGICDSIVVLLGTAVTYGINIRPIWDEVNRTNMLKKGGELREDGKRLKPEGWQSPDIADILERQRR